MSTEIRHHFIETNGIRMHVAEAGAGFPVVFCHGFPELWYSWRHQIDALAKAGFRAIAPDMRGYGDTDAPADPAAYTSRVVAADIAGLLDALGLEKAVVVGHDWGGVVVWHFGLRYPERTERLISLNTPFLPPGDQPLVEAFRDMLGLTDETFYMQYFQKPGVAEAELAADVRGTFTKMMRSARYAQDMFTFASVGGDGSGVLTRIGPGETLLSEADLDVYEATFRRTGFRGGLSWYRAESHSWKEERTLPSFLIKAPSLMITAEKDAILRPELAQGMRPFVPDLRIEQINDCSHWTQQEKPAEVNALILDFLGGLPSPAGR
jgi:soluble epoxide hydrolase / lipid-phosphate phosphatase